MTSHLLFDDEEERGGAGTVQIQQNSPLVFFNHFYIVLDSATYQAMEQDMFLRKHFAPNEQRTTVRTDETYTGLYFYGTNTYFEVFDASNSPRLEVGDCGIAFGVEKKGDIRILQEKLGAELETVPKPITRLYHGKQIPWFFMATVKDLPYESRTSTWLMEYHPAFLAKWNTQPDGENVGILRSDILKRYSEVLEPVNHPFLEDVVELTLAADEPIIDKFVKFCMRVGYGTERGAGGTIALNGPDFVLRLVLARTAAQGVREIRMRTRNVVPSAAECQFGQSLLKFEDRGAILSFR
jgi:hypothetical protein